jgi:hypothetical protein
MAFRLASKARYAFHAPHTHQLDDELVPARAGVREPLLRGIIVHVLDLHLLVDAHAFASGKLFLHVDGPTSSMRTRARITTARHPGDHHHHVQRMWSWNHSGAKGRPHDLKKLERNVCADPLWHEGGAFPCTQSLLPHAPLPLQDQESGVSHTSGMTAGIEFDPPHPFL